MNIPPKSLKHRIPRTRSESRDPGDPSSSTLRPDVLLKSLEASRGSIPSLRSSSSEIADIGDVSAESLPVLKAFQEFIETERRHARRQVMVVTTFFLMLFVLVTGAGAFFGYVFFSQMNTDMAILRSELASANTRVRKDTADMISTLAERTDSLPNSSDMIKNASLEISNTFSTALSARQAEMDQIRSALKAVQLQNNELRTMFTDLALPDPSVSTSKTMADSGILPTSGETAQIATSKASNLQENESPHPLEIAILAPGANEPVKWRIPISE